MTLHDIVHWLHWQRGEVVTSIDPRGNVWVGYRCITCGKITGKHIARMPYEPKEPDDAEYS